MATLRIKMKMFNVTMVML